MGQVKFVAATLAGYSGLTTKDADTLYFVTEEQRIYKGDKPYSGGIYKKVDTLPQTGEINTLYVVGDKGDNVSYWDGTKYISVVKPTTVAADLSALEGRVTTAEGKITTAEGRVTTAEDKLATIQGEGEGSIKKAADDAQAAAIDAAATDAETKANAAQAAAIADAESKLSAAKKELQTAIDGKATKATTLAGYGITDAYTSAQTDTKISKAIADAPHLKRAIVNSLPTATEADTNTIYMVPKAAGAAGNVDGNGYTEHMVINGKWEQIGDTAVDLTNYATKTYAGEKANAALTSAKTYAEGQASAAKTSAITAAAEDATTKADAAKNAAIAAAATDATTKASAAQAAAEKTAAADATKKADAALNSAKTYADSLATNYATAEQGAKADTALQGVDITTGATNGTIAVKGTDVTVKGLGSAAFVETSKFDTAGAANTALNTAKKYTDDKITEALTWGTL